MLEKIPTKTLLPHAMKLARKSFSLFVNLKFLVAKFGVLEHPKHHPVYNHGVPVPSLPLGLYINLLPS